jgi:hypothetical protein
MNNRKMTAALLLAAAALAPGLSSRSLRPPRSRRRRNPDAKVRQ